MTKLTATQQARLPERNSTWYVNDSIIKRTYSELTDSLGRVPVVRELVDATGLSQQTVTDHLKSLRMADFSSGYILRTTKVIEKLYTNAENGDVPAANLLFKYVVPNDTQITGDNNGTTNIQINFVVKGEEVTNVD